MKIPNWSELTQREKLFAFSAAFFALLFAGSIVARLLGSSDLNWEAIGALAAVVALVALPLALIGYMDNKNGQRLEHRPYIRLVVQELTLIPDQCVRFEVAPVNYGRTPAHNLRVRGSAHYLNRNANFDAIVDAFDAQARERMSIHPGQLESYIECPTHLVLTAVEIAHIPATMTVFLRISCLYEDGFGRSYETRITSFISRIHEAQFAMQHTPIGNWAT